MKIEFSKEQFWHLMRAVYLADWIANSTLESDIEDDKGISNIQSYILSFAKEMGYDNYVEYDKKHDKYFETSDLDEAVGIRNLIDRYDEYTTWEKIASWLGDRDFFNNYSESEIDKMDERELFLKQMECQIYWEHEFENYGVSRLFNNDVDENLWKWHKYKGDLIDSNKKIYFHEREIWWCSLGKNIGFEQNGKGQEFTRPVIVMKRLSLDTAVVIPLTTSKKRRNLFELRDVTIANTTEKSYAMTEQIRLIDCKRLGMKIGVIDEAIFKDLQEYVKKVIFGHSQ